MTEAIEKVAADTVVADTAATTTTAAATTTETAKEATAAADTSKATATAATTEKAAGATEEAKGTWPESWREEMAGGDEAVAKLINRYGSPKGIAKALLEKETLIRSGQVKKAAPDPKDEKAVAEWRKEQGIPEAATDYKPPTIKGHEWTDEDKPVLATYFEMAHAKGLPQAVLDANLEIYANLQRDAQEKQFNFDKEHRVNTEEDLRKDWGPEFRANMTLAKRALADVPEVGDLWAEARLPDGRLLGSVPGFIRWASDLGRQAHGDAAFIEGDGKSRGSSRLTEIREMQTKEPDKYWSKEIQAEELDLLARESKSKSAKR